MKHVTLHARQWRKIAQRILEAWGTPQDAAACVASSLVESDLSGVPSHGMIRVSDYVNMVKMGWLRPEGRPSVKGETEATTLVDGGYGFGQPAAHFALDASMPKARAAGIAAASILHCGHIGRLGEYAEKAAAQGLVTLVAASSGGNGGLVVPFGGIERVFSTNPMAAGVPARNHAPFILDFATSTVAAGKLELAPDKDKPIPEGWAVDPAGNPARTARQFLEGGGLLPFGGHKGYALSLLVELVCSLMTGAGVPLRPVTPDRRGLGFGGNAAFLVLIDVGHFTDVERFLTDVDSLFQRLEAVTPAPGFTRVAIPGSPEHEKRSANTAQEISVEEAIWDRIATVAAEKGVDLGPLRAG